MTDNAPSSLFAMRFGVRQKMVLVLLTILTVALTIMSWITVRDFRSNVIVETQKRGQEVAEFLAQAVAPGIVAYDYQTMQLLLDKLVKSQDITFAQVLNPKGAPMATAGNTSSHEDNIKYYTQPVEFDAEVVGQVTVGFDNRRILSQLDTQKNSFILREIGIVLMIAIGEFLALSYLIVRPVSAISRSLKPANASGSASSPEIITLVSNDEFGELAKQFNDIRTQLADANVRLQGKVDTAGQQLRENNERLLRQSEELHRMNEQLKQLSITDPLTGLYNRRQFQELMNTEVMLSVRHGDANSLLVIDIDHFKSINDKHGHSAGDRVLRRVAELLVDNVRRSDMVCRVGGEEFVVCLRRAPAEYALLVAEKLRKKIHEAAVAIGNDFIPVTVSIGIASIPSSQPIHTAEELFDQADNALYFSKQSGRNRVTHYRALTTATVRDGA